MKTNLKVKILDSLIAILHSKKRVTKSAQFKFTNEQLTDSTDGWKTSVTRELRWLKKNGYIDYQVLDRLKGVYILQNVGDKPLSKDELLKTLREGREKLLSKPTKDSATSMVRRLLDNNRNLPKVSS